jgi:hypothetical protein
MKRVIKLTESDVYRIVRKIIIEQGNRTETGTSVYQKNYNEINKWLNNQGFSSQDNKKFEKKLGTNQDYSFDVTITGINNLVINVISEKEKFQPVNLTGNSFNVANLEREYRAVLSDIRKTETAANQNR